MSAKLVVLISGNGSNLQAILNACAGNEIPASVVAVFSNIADAYGLTRACNAGVPAIHCAKSPDESRRDYDNRLADGVARYQPDYVVLAGWMRLLTSAFLDRFPNRVINLHPALPGSYPGTHAIERAYAAHQRGEINYSGLMVHLVPDEGVDAGPVLATQQIFFLPGEPLEEFEARVHAAEHHLLVNTLKTLLSMVPVFAWDGVTQRSYRMPTAILSVHDKTGLVDFAKGLAGLGWALLASGGTAKLLRENGLAVTEVADYTKSPEILGGRVKTLHPAIHGGLLARPTHADHQQLLDLGWDYIDLVAVNLYPFEATIAKPDVTYAEAIENIDIGGVTLIRAAAKNHERVTLVCDPADYAAVLAELRSGGISPETRKQLSVKGFACTMQYDTSIYTYLSK